MTALSNHVRLEKSVRLGLPLVALLAVALTLLLPGLGIGAARRADSSEPTISGGTSVGDTLTGSTRHVGSRRGQLQVELAPLPAGRRPGSGQLRGHHRRSVERVRPSGTGRGLHDPPPGQGVRRRWQQDRSQYLERDREGDRTGRRPDEHRPADGHGHRRRRADADREPGELGEQVPRGLRQRLAALRRGRRQLRAVRRGRHDVRRRRRGQGLDTARARDGDEPGRDDARSRPIRRQSFPALRPWLRRLRRLASAAPSDGRRLPGGKPRGPGVGGDVAGPADRRPAGRSRRPRFPARPDRTSSSATASPTPAASPCRARSCTRLRSRSGSSRRRSRRRPGRPASSA